MHCFSTSKGFEAQVNTGLDCAIAYNHQGRIPRIKMPVMTDDKCVKVKFMQ
jgi:hypothetical protein